MGKLFQELKRRKVFRVAAVYAVVAWLLIQIAGEILPTFDAPDWVNQTIILVLLMGFPVAIVLAWAFEIVPDGVKSDADAPTKHQTNQSTDRNLIYAILGLVLLVAGFQVTDRFVLGDREGGLVLQDPDSTNIEPPIRLAINLGEFEIRPIARLRNDIAISPDGTLLTYMGVQDGVGRLYIFESSGQSIS